jgi:hypothetical protein
VASDAQIFRTYWLVYGGTRGAQTRTAAQCHCSLTHVARVLSRHQAKAIPRGAPVQAVNSAPVRKDYVTPRLRVYPPGLDQADITRTAQWCADWSLALFVVMLWLAVCLVWVPWLNAALGGAALAAGHVAAGMGRAWRDAG